MQIDSPQWLSGRAAIVLLAWAVGSCSSSDSDLVGVDAVTGAVNVAVTSSGSSDFSITVVLTGPEGFAPRTATMRLGGTATFPDLEPGPYTVSTAIFGFDCQSVSADVQARRTTTASIACTRRTIPITGIVSGVVTSGDSTIGEASVELTAHGVSYTRTSGANGTISFVGVQAGEYTLTAFHQNFTCPIQTLLVDPSQRTTFAISCTPETTGMITGIVIVGSDTGSPALQATVHLTGPASRTAIPGSRGSFTFDELQPGTYTLTASDLFMSCQVLIVDVRAARTTTVQISCNDRAPLGSEIQGTWGYNRLLRSQTGNCPRPLPATATGSMAFNHDNSSIEIVGLDPALAIVGVYDEDSGIYVGNGAAVSGDGSSIQTDVMITFAFSGWDYWDYYSVVGFYTDATPTSVWTRRHRDPSGALVCTEVYGASGGPS